MKKLLKNEKMGAYEMEHNRASYRTLVERVVGDMVLCNNIYQVDDTIFDNVIVGDIYDESGEMIEIFQFYICNINDWNIEYIKELTKDNNDIIIAYSEILDCYVLMVDHFGTSWDYVLTSVELSDDINECI